MYTAGRAPLRSSMSCAKIWNTYGWNSVTSSCASHYMIKKLGEQIQGI